MCVVSNIGDYGQRIWPKPRRLDPPSEPINIPTLFPVVPPPYNGPTREQFEEFLKLLRAARKFDVAAGQPDCPATEKIGWMKELAVLLKIDPKKIDEILLAK